MSHCEKSTGITRKHTWTPMFQKELERFMSRNLDSLAGAGPDADYASYAILNGDGKLVGFTW